MTDNRVGVYQKNGASVSRFSKKYYDEWDEHGRKVCENFFSNYKKWQIVNNDGKGSPLLNPCDTDLRVKTKNNQVAYVECETKRSGFKPEYLEKGIHYTWRKISGIFGHKKREPKKTLFVTVNADGDQLVLVRGQYLYLAYKIWPNYAGFGNLDSTFNFKVPEHECYPIYKSTYRGQDPEHFVSISWDRCMHFKFDKQKNNWIKIKDSDKKYLDE